MLLNLLTNAIKFSNKGTILVQACVVEGIEYEDDLLLSVSVQD